jgi:hypothetical protein
MSVLVTETNAFQPRALVISDQHILAEQMVSFFHQSDFQVEWWGRAAVAEAAQTQVDLGVFDKIVVVFFGSVKEVSDQVLSLISAHQSKLAVLLPYTPPFSSSERFLKELVTQTTYVYDLGVYVQAVLPHAKLFFLQDVWYPDDPSYALEQWLPHLLRPKQNAVLNNPEGDLFPQTLDQVWAKIQKALLTPGREKYLVRGKKVSWPKFAELLQQKAEEHWQRPYSLCQVFRPETTQPYTKTLISTGLPENLLFQYVLLQYPVELTKSRQITVDEVAQPSVVPFSSSPPRYPAGADGGSLVTRKKGVVLLHSPQVENRMKKYEKKMAEVAHRQRLKPVRKESGGVRPVASPRSPHKTPEEKVFEEEINRLFGTERVQKKVTLVKKKVKDQKEIRQKGRYRSVVLVFSSIVAGIGLGFIAMWGSFLLAKNISAQTVLRVAEKAQKNMPLSDQDLTQLSGQMTNLNKVLSFEVETYKIIFGQDKLKEEELLASVGSELPQVYQLSRQFKQHLTSLVLQLFSQQAGDDQVTLHQVENDANEAYKRLSLLQNQVKAYAAEVDDEAQSQLLQQFASKIQEQRKLMAIQIQLQQALPNLLGFEGKKTYALLLQNNQELRATGGFLQSIALITVDKGVLIDTQVFDVSALDKAFSGQVAPPPEVQAYLGSKSWLLRDANWDPDFTQSAQQTQWFLEKMVGKKVDGVIGINLYVVQSLLKQLGPLVLPEYNETLTDKNLFDRIEFHSEIKLVESGKPEYLSTVLTKLIGKVMAVPQTQVLPLVATVYENVKFGQATVFVDQPDKNALLNSLGWAGDVTTPQCPAPFNDQACVTDTFYQVESNIGVNKANYTLERKMNHTVTLAPNEISHKRVIDLKNTAVSNAWPLGSYKAYIRFYVPETSILQEIRVNDVSLPPSAVVTKTDHNKKYFGVVVDVPVGMTKQMVLTYTEPLSTPMPFSYVFFEQKQPGTGDDPYSLTLQYPDSFHPTIIAPQAEVNGQTTTFSSTRDKNLFMGVKFN